MIEESQVVGAGPVATVSYGFAASDQATLTYPNGRALDWTYHYPGGPLKEAKDDGAATAIAQFDYLGGRTLLRQSPGGGLDLDFRAAAGAALFDDTGRPTQWLFRNPAASGSPTVIGYEWAYDGNGNKMYQRSLHDPLDSQRYAYDSADRLTAFVRGACFGGFSPFSMRRAGNRQPPRIPARQGSRAKHTTFDATTPAGYCAASTTTWPSLHAYEGWDLDGLGNWSRFATRTTTQTEATVEQRTDDTVNAYATVGAATLTHDANGNLTRDELGRTLRWDAFNRLREVLSTTGTLIATYTYDTGNRRMRKALGPGARAGQSTDYKWSGWRSIEESAPAAATPRIQRVYGNYIDEILCEDTNANADATCTDFGTGWPAGTGTVGPDRRTYPLQTDLYSQAATWDPAAVASGGGSGGSTVTGGVVEAFEFNPYGPAARLTDGNDDDVVVDFDGSDLRMPFDPNNRSAAFAIIYGGHGSDEESGLIYARNRFYGSFAGCWLSRDPVEEYRGPNLYLFLRDAPTVFYDPLGLTEVHEVLDAFFSKSTTERLWVMGPDDEYTAHVRRWVAVQKAVKAAEADLQKNCNTWSTSHMTDPAWTPGMGSYPVAHDPNAWVHGERSPAGTDPDTAKKAYAIYLATGGRIQTDALWTSAIGSFDIYVTVDKIDCACRTAKLRVWMYNPMDKRSFGRFASMFPGSGMAPQHMWWNWTEDYDWGSAPPVGGSGPAGGTRPGDWTWRG